MEAVGGRDATGQSLASSVKRAIGTAMCVSLLLILAGFTYAGAASPMEHASEHKQFAAIDNMAMPGLPEANWPTIQFVDLPPRPGDTANVGSNDLK